MLRAVARRGEVGGSHRLDNERWLRHWRRTLAPSLSLVVLVSGCGFVPEDTAGGGLETTLTRTTEDLSARGRSDEPSSTQPAPTTTMTATVHPLTLPPQFGPSGDPAGSPPADGVAVSVVSITDGDTLDARLTDGTVESVRLIGINSPERGECFADEAADALAAMAPSGSEVTVTSDTTDRDQYGRLLRYLWVGGMSVNEELVRRGAAISRRYPPDLAMAERFELAQSDAVARQVGLWEPDACGDAADATIRIVGLVYDPPGDDNLTLNEEWVRILNDGDAPVDLTGWTIKDESASHRYTFPNAFTLTPGETATIHSGCGDDFSTDLYWCNQGSAIWNNDGDTAFLTDPNGNIHTRYHYQPAAITTSATTTATTVATTTTAVAPTTTTQSNCHPSYEGACVPVNVSDVDCAGGSGDGPYYVGTVRVVGPDVYGLDRDHDGLGCE